MAENIRSLIHEVLEKGHLMSLATQDDGGVWVADVIYVYDDGLNIYWMSDPDVRHSQAIEQHAQVAATITASLPGVPGLGVQVSGIAQKIEGERYDLALKHFAKRGKPAPTETDDVRQGDFWYVLKPSLIELINEEHFGFTKQKLVL